MNEPTRTPSPRPKLLPFVLRRRAPRPRHWSTTGGLWGRPEFGSEVSMVFPKRSLGYVLGL